MAHNLLRAAGTLAGSRYAKARTATIRRDLITVGARTARHGRGHLILHLPAGHHREQAWQNLWTRPAVRPPARPDQPEPVRTPTPQGTPSPDPGPGTPDTLQNRQQQGKHTRECLVEARANNRRTRHLTGGSRLSDHGGDDKTRLRHRPNLPARVFLCGETRHSHVLKWDTVTRSNVKLQVGEVFRTLNLSVI